MKCHLCDTRQFCNLLFEFHHRYLHFDEIELLNNLFKSVFASIVFQELLLNMLPNRGPNDFEGRMPRQTLLLLSDTKDKQDAVLSKYF